MIDGLDVTGWVWDAPHPALSLPVALEIEGSVVATTIADQYRPDLETAGIGDGRHGFRISPPGSTLVRPESVAVVVPSISYRIPIGPRAFARR